MCSSDLKRATERRDKVLRMMNPAQVAEAQRQATEQYRAQAQKLATEKAASHKLKFVLDWQKAAAEKARG